MVFTNSFRLMKIDLWTFGSNWNMFLFNLFAKYFASCYIVILISNPLSLYKAILDLTFQLFPLRTREQIFLHGWIACHTHHQGCKELTNALQKIRAPLKDSGNFVVAYFCTSHDGHVRTFVQTNDTSINILKKTKTWKFGVHEDCYKWWRHMCFLFPNLRSFPSTGQPHLGATSHSHHGNGTAQHWHASMSLGEGLTLQFQPVTGINEGETIMAGPSIPLPTYPPQRNKVLLNPYFWGRYIRGGRWTSHKTNLDVLLRYGCWVM